MRYVDEFRSGELARALAAELAETMPPGRELALMEVCGGHTHAIYKHGIDELLPPGLELVHGPGCPVCVIPVGRVNDAIALALANPEREVVFFAIGFETTTPSTAITLLQARAEGIGNFSVFCNHVTIAPPLRAILDAPELRLDGLIAPGHVSAVIGSRPYDFIASEYNRPVVVAGFEPLDILQSVLMLVRQLAAGRAEVENQYTRVVRRDGNPRALEAIEQTMELRDNFEWRGLGSIPKSGLRLREEFADWDAEQRYEVPGISVPDHKACQCGQVLRGLVKPWECKVFGTACTPERPIGTCMVSSEGACAAYYHYGRNRPKRGTVTA